MFPIILDPKHIRFVLVGNEFAAQKRLAQLQKAGAKHIKIFSPAPCHCMAETSGSARIPRLPKRSELKNAHIVYIIELDKKVEEKLAAQCRKMCVIVNVEDVIPLCDFHTPSQVRSGDLLLTISTKGKSPGLARRLRKYLSATFGTPQWGERLDILAEKRQKWRSQGLMLKQVSRKTDEFIDAQGWLD